MKLTKAKEILDLNIRQRSPRMPPDVLDALKLGIEALDHILRQRRGNPGIAYTILKGETSE